MTLEDLDVLEQEWKRNGHGMSALFAVALNRHLGALLRLARERLEQQMPPNCKRCGHSFESHTNAACVQGCYECHDCPHYVEFAPEQTESKRKGGQ